MAETAEPITKELKLIAADSKGNLRRWPVLATYRGSRIEFQFPFNRPLMEEIKSMAGSKWHGNDDTPRKIWSISNCQRNRYNLEYLQGGDPFEWFYQPVRDWGSNRPLFEHQKDLVNKAMTYHFREWAAEMGLGKSLAAIEVMEKSGYDDAWWVGPHSALRAVERELDKWHSEVTPELLTYEAVVKRVKGWKEGQVPPRILIVDEAHHIKNAQPQRSQAILYLANAIREHWGYECYIIVMTGTPSPKSPVDWWHQLEVVCPGFIREGSPNAFERRLGFFEHVIDPIGKSFWKPAGWRDDENKCIHCGHYEDYEAHDTIASSLLGFDYHEYKKSINEVSLLYERLGPLVDIKKKADCLDLPEMHHRIIECYPKPSTLRAAQVIARSAPNAITAMTLLRELSDGFQYTEKKNGKTTCPQCKGNGEVVEWFDPDDDERVFASNEFLSEDLTERLVERTVTCPYCDGEKEVDRIEREAKFIPCPKEDVLKELLEENDEIGRIVIFAGFTGSVDRCVQVAQKQNWSIIRVDGRGWWTVDPEGNRIDIDPLDLWADVTSNSPQSRRVAFIAHPGSGGVGLTLVEACMVIFYSNDFNPAYRQQAMARIHRPGMDLNRGATCVDLVHLPSDQRVLDVLDENRRIELMTMGELQDCLKKAKVQNA